jgi:6-pyruvoyltetrahydropterin/6-carboxytetrahydropterin synthase|uniref:6-carboxy-5,6,7,8-tetrahydropterin synthase n=1 Tax=candidate division WOR-3 bacterium TaxID=2052148 RepID=A0A7V3PTZ3_UNCW3
MYRVRVSKNFSAAHRILGQGGRCEELHGHNYRVEVIVGKKNLNSPGIVVDFNELRSRLEQILPDHRLLNEVYDFNPTAENLARHFFEQLAEFYPVSSVRVWENEECWAEYQPD